MKEIEKRVPYKHQIEATKTAKEYYKDNDRGYIIQPCGSGKTYNSVLIARSLWARKIVVAVPNIALQAQALRDWIHEIKASGEEEYDILCLSSDETVTSDIEYSRRLISTTDEYQIKMFLKLSRRFIVITTYQSGHLLGEVSKEVGMQFNFGIFDEAHRTVGEMDKHFAQLVFDKNINIQRRLFMTASYKVYDGEDDVVSMDNKEVYGEEIYSLSWKKAIERSIICDYKVAPIICSEKEITKFEESNPNVVDIEHGISGEENFLMVSAAISITKCINKYGLKKIVSYHSTREKAQIFKRLIGNISNLQDTKIGSHYIDGDMSSSEKSKELKKFEESKDPVVLTNCKALVEGIDIPPIDGIVFVDKKSSTVDIMQAVGRSVRIFPGKKEGVVILPTFTESMENFMDSKGFADIKRVLISMASFDDNIISHHKYSTKSLIQDKVLWGPPNDMDIKSIDVEDMMESFEVNISKSIRRICMDYISLEELKGFISNNNINNLSMYRRKRKENNGIFNNKRLPSDPKGFFEKEKIFLHRRNIYKYKGKEYTLGGLAKHPDCKVTYNVLSNRLSEGWSVERAMTTPLKKGKTYKYKGKGYTMGELAEHPDCKVDISTLHHRLNGLEWSVERAVTTPSKKLKTYKYKGGEYTREELAEHPDCKVNVRTLHHRLDKKWSVERAVTTPIKKGKTYKYKGKEYTMGELAKHPDCKVSKNILYSRLSGGWLVERAMTTPSKKLKTYKYKGKEYTITELAEHPDCKVSKNILYNRLNGGWSVERAVTTPVKKRKIYKYKGGEYTMGELVKHPDCKVDTSTLHHRLDGLGWSVERAVTAPIKKGKTYKYKGKEYTMGELAKHPDCKVTYNILASRFDKKWSVERAVTTPSKKLKTYKYKRKEYTREELAEHPDCKVSKHVICHRLGKGWSVEKAMTTPPKKGKIYKYKGKEYFLKELAEHPDCKVSISALSNRLNSLGWSVERAVTAPNKKTERTYKYKGKEYFLKELAKHPDCKVTYNILANRLGRGWSVERAVTTPTQR